MTCLNYDFKRFELNEELKQRNQIKAGDLMRDFREDTDRSQSVSASSKKAPKKEDEDAYKKLSDLKVKMI